MTQLVSHSLDLLQLVVFKVHTEEYGIDILRVQEIIRMMDITRVPRAPRFVNGVINLRGTVIPVIDMRGRFGIENQNPTNDTRIIVINLAPVMIGFIVDSVAEVLRIPADSVEAPPSVVATVDADYISGVSKQGDRLLVLLDPQKLVEQDNEALQALTETHIADVEIA